MVFAVSIPFDIFATLYSITICVLFIAFSILYEKGFCGYHTHCIMFCFCCWTCCVYLDVAFCIMTVLVISASFLTMFEVQLFFNGDYDTLLYMCECVFGVQLAHGNLILLSGINIF